MNAPARPVLRLHGLEVGYDGRRLLHGVDLEVSSGQLVGLLGANGAGKSSTLQTIVGTLPALGGQILLNGQDIARWPIRRRIRSGIGFSPEGRRVFAGMTVLANLLVGNAALPRRRQREGLDRVLELFPELDRRRDQPAGTLSGGEQQMVAIARAMMGRPRLLLVEEPSQGLAPALVDRVYAGLRAAADDGVAVLIAEQFQQLRPDAVDHVVAIAGGTVRAAAPTERAAP